MGLRAFYSDVFWNETPVRYNKRAREPRPYEELLMCLMTLRYNGRLLKSQRDDTFIEYQDTKKNKPQRGDTPFLCCLNRRLRGKHGGRGRKRGVTERTVFGTHKRTRSL